MKKAYRVTRVFRKSTAVVLCCWILLMTACAAHAVPVSWSYELSNTGSLYTYTFHFMNSGNVKDAVFKIHIDGGAVPQEWATSSWNLPTGWQGDRADKYLDFQTGNGSWPADGWYRLYGKPDAPAPAMGWMSQDFEWSFTLNGGPMPTNSFFLASDVKIHIQPLNADWTNGGVTYWVNPIPVPEPSGLLALVSGLAGLNVMVRRRVG